MAYPLVLNNKYLDATISFTFQCLTRNNITSYLKTPPPMRPLLVITLVIISLLVISGVRQIVASNRLAELTSEAERELEIKARNAIEFTNEYALAAVTLAKNPLIRNAVINSGEGALEDANEAMEFSQLIHSAQDIKLIARNGDIVVNTNGGLSGVSMIDRDHVNVALKGRLGRKSLYLGETNRMYAVAAPIFYQQQVIGVVEISVAMGDLELSWALLPEPLVAVTDEGRIFISNVADWKRFNYVDSLGGGHRVLLEEVRNDNQVLLSRFAGKKYRRYITVKRDVPLMDWQIYHFSSYQDVERSVTRATVVTVFVLAFIGMIWLLIRQRGIRIERELEQQHEFAKMLEDKVARRTEELKLTNVSLQKEIDERRAAEADLKQAQKGLVQATKMASIGQMSATLAHEYNQPIAAIRFYADNARELFAQDKFDSLNDNLSRIVSLTDRMSSLTNSLRNFSHTPQESAHKVRFSTVLEEVIVLNQPRLSKDNVELEIVGDASDIWVMAGHTRVVQVLTNLISNALDAMQEVSHRCLTIETIKQGQFVQCLVKDLGPGLSQDKRDQVFEAFYTTKSMGQGLGLGLFVVKNLVNSLGGELSVLDQPAFGAVFAFTLPLA